MQEISIERLAEVGVVPSVIEERNDLPLSGQKFVLTGTLSVFSRDDATKLLELLGADVLTSVSKNTTCVVAGANAGSKLKKAEALGVKVINEDEFQKIIENARAR